MLNLIENELIQEIQDEISHRKKVKIYVLRLDKIDLLIGGNKFFKLKYNIEYALSHGFKRILSFGGAYSNHIAALAKIGNDHDIQTIGVIRGDELTKDSNKTLALASKHGMQFHFISREEYRNRNQATFINKLGEILGDFFMVPEGGSNIFAVKGCMEIPDYFNQKPDYVICPCGTGGTIAGISLGLNAETQAIGIPVLKNASFLIQEIASLQTNFLENNPNITPHSPTLIFDYHFGGYAKKTIALEKFIRRFYHNHNIPLDPIYNGKSFFALYDLLEKGYFKENSTIFMVHTGGMQAF